MDAGIAFFAAVGYIFLIFVFTAYYVTKASQRNSSVIIKTKNHANTTQGVTTSNPTPIPVPPTTTPTADTTCQENAYLLAHVPAGLTGDSYLTDVFSINETSESELQFTSSDISHVTYNKSFALFKNAVNFMLYSNKTSPLTLINTLDKTSYFVAINHDTYVIVSALSNCSGVQADIYYENNVDKSFTLKTMDLYSVLPTQMLFHGSSIIFVFHNAEIYVVNAQNTLQHKQYFLEDLNFTKTIDSIFSYQGYVYIFSYTSQYVDVFLCNGVELKKAYSLNLPIVPKLSKLLCNRLIICNDHDVYVYESQQFSRVIRLFGEEKVIDIAVQHQKLIVSTTNKRVVRATI